MNTLRILTFLAIVTLAATSARASDAIKTTSGITYSGKIIELNWDKVTIEVGLGSNKSNKEIPTNQIVAIFFDSGTAAVKKAMQSAKKDIAVDHHYADGLKSLAKINPSDLNSDDLKQDYNYYTALANAKLALSGSGEIKDAGKAMLEFVNKNQQSYHFLEACEVLGDLLVAKRSYPLAEEYYGKLAKAPWPETKMKAGVLVGRVQLAQNKFDEAEKSFQTVLDDASEGPLAESQRQAALLGKASVLIGQKKAEEAIKILGGIIDKGDADDAELMARTYNALGNAYRQQGDLNEAKFAFLHTDQLYSTVPEAHAEALANLAEIWDQLHKPDRAVETKKTLEKLYKNSPWVKSEK